MSEQQWDLVVIGGGSGGVRAARIAASLGAKVALVEQQYLGGTCVNVGCVPKKLMYLSARSGQWLHEGLAAYGWKGATPAFDWTTLRDNVANEVGRLNGIYRSLLDNSGVELIEGAGRLVGLNQVAVSEDLVLTSERILIATGGTPFVPSFEGAEHCITSDEVFSLPQWPQRLVVVGAGYIGVEMAGIFNHLGAQVTQVVRGDQILRGFDDDIRFHLAQTMRDSGVDLRCHREIQSVTRAADGSLRVLLDDGNTVLADQVLLAVGRSPNSSKLNLDSVGVSTTCRGAIEVNEQFQSSVSSIYAVGDVIDRVALTPVAIQEGMALAKHWFADEPIDMDYAGIPTAVFSSPNVGTVGLTEAQAKDAGHGVEIKSSTFRAMPDTLPKRDRKVMMKLILEADTQRILGMHMVGDDAGEIIQGFAVALKLGATLKDFHRTVGIHPTLAEEWVTMR